MMMMMMMMMMTKVYNNDNDDIKGGRNDDYENVNSNCETSQTFFGRPLLISSFASSPIPFSFVGIKLKKLERKKRFLKLSRHVMLFV